MWNPPIALTPEEQKIAARTRKTRKSGLDHGVGPPSASERGTNMQPRRTEVCEDSAFILRRPHVADAVIETTRISRPHETKA